MSDIRRQAARGTAWMIAARQAVRFMGLISTFVLARILMPEDFGLVAQSMMVVGFIELLSSLGFEMSLIQDQKAGRDKYNTAWTLNVIKGVASVVLLVVVAAPMADFFNEPRLENVIYALAGVSLVRGFVNIGIVDFRKKLWFGPDFALMVGPKLIAIIFNIGFALYLRSYWALVIGAAANAGTSMIMSYIASKYRPRLSLSAWREMFNFSKWLLVNDYLMYVLRQAPVFLIGRLLGTAQVGYYRMAAEIGNLVSAEISLPILRALFPAYSKDKDGAADLYLQAVGVCFLVLAPACVGIALVARPAVELVLGKPWLPIVPLVEIIAIARLLGALWLNPAMVALARGRSRDSSFLIMGKVATLVPALAVFTPLYGIEGVAWALLVSASIDYLVALGYVVAVLKIPFASIVMTKWRTMISVGVMTAVLLQMPEDLWRIPAGAGVYVAVQFILWHITGRSRGPEYHVFTRLGFKA